MNLNYLECFSSLSETLSFTETAKDFAVSQPSISRQIKLLEEQLNTKLFIRDKHKVHLTEQGLKFKQRINPLIKELKLIMEKTQNQSEKIQGTIHFGSLSEVGQYSLMDVLLKFQNLHPNVNLDMNFISPQSIIEKIKTGSLDFGVVNDFIDQENIKSFKILKEKSVLVTKYSNSKTIEENDNPEFVCYSYNDKLLIDFLHKFYKKVSLSKINRKVIVNSHRSMIESLTHSSAYAVLPYFSVEKAIKEKELKIASEKELKSELYLIYLDNNLMARRNMEFKKFIIEEMKEKNIN